MKKGRGAADLTVKSHIMPKVFRRATPAEIRATLKQMSPEDRQRYRRVVAFEKWQSAPYDGIKGELPVWVPRYFRNIFSSLQGSLFRAVFVKQTTYKQLKKCLDGMPRRRIQLLAWMPRYPWIADVWRLAEIKWAVDHGEVEGLRFFGGDRAASGAKQYRGAKAAHEKTHGTAEERDAKYESYRKAAEELKAKNPCLSKTDIRKRVASRFRVSPKTIQRNVKI